MCNLLTPEEIHDFREKGREAWQQRGDAWRDWRQDVWDYRADRANEIRNSIRDAHDHWFTPDWWHGCGWWYGGSINIYLNPWWWWQPVVWPGYSVIYGSVPPEPIAYDYGTDIVMEGSHIYVEGERTDSAADTASKPWRWPIPKMCLHPQRRSMRTMPALFPSGCGPSSSRRKAMPSCSTSSP